MKLADVLKILCADAIDLRLSDDGEKILATGTLTDRHRDIVRENRPELVVFLLEVRHTATALIESAMRACDHFNDGPAARQQMRDDCLATPPHLAADLLAHFKQTYPESKTWTQTLKP